MIDLIRETLTRKENTLIEILENITIESKLSKVNRNYSLEDLEKEEIEITAQIKLLRFLISEQLRIINKKPSPDKDGWFDVEIDKPLEGTRCVIRFRHRTKRKAIYIKGAFYQEEGLSNLIMYNQDNIIKWKHKIPTP